MTIEPCNNTSVGIIVKRNECLLMIERRRPPYGWAAPAGHVDDGESYIEAARRELMEEVGLSAGPNTLTLVAGGTYGNRCRRPGGTHHRWEVFETYRDQSDPVRNQDEVRAMAWMTLPEIASLARLCRSHLNRNAGPDEWRDYPGLEPIWLEFFTDLGYVLAGELHLPGQRITRARREDEE
jgi:8-oxo-dGTP pyrophosphatase MutT (NUDIX family)